MKKLWDGLSHQGKAWVLVMIGVVLVVAVSMPGTVAFWLSWMLSRLICAFYPLLELVVVVGIVYFFWSIARR